MYLLHPLFRLIRLLSLLAQGVANQNVKQRKHDVVPEFGAAKSLPRHQIANILRTLVIKDYLEESNEENGAGWINTYVKPGRFADVIGSTSRHIVEVVVARSSSSSAVGGSGSKEASNGTASGTKRAAKYVESIILFIK